MNQVIDVAPYVGAWIETLSVTASSNLLVSHPMWVRGLKLLNSQQVQGVDVAPYVGAWIETRCGQR